ncbi:hypothetical protein QZH41_016420, partial [Actinostola sp. cb2023]
MSTKQKKKNKGGGIKERNPYKLRNGHKAYATKLISETKELLNESSPEVREKLKILTISLNEILQKIADLDEEILDQVDSEEEIAEEIETAGSFRAGMHEVVVKIDDLLISRSQRPQRSDTNVEKVVSTKLPKLELRKFKGDPKEWITFWERFSSAVHDNPTISDVDKFNYLKGLLEGSALTTVAAKTEDQEVLKSPEPDVDRLWDLESIGIKEKETVLDTFEKNVTYDDNRYCVTLPLKDKHQTLPDYYELSLARLRNLTKRLYKTPDVLKEYKKIFTEQLQNGIIEKVDREQEPFPGQVHYLPHQAVIREDAVTTKLRVVFDASAKVKPSSPSLNECTYTGPSLISQIFENLTRFRSHKIGLVSDIEKAFLNIAVTKEQRDLMRFLWIDDVTKPDPTVEVYRFCRVIFGMNCSPFLLNATLKHHISKYYSQDPETAQKVQSSLYVDDWSCGGENEDETFKLYQATRACFAAGGFNLRKWASNSKELMQQIIQDEKVNESAPSTVKQEDESYAKISVGGLDEITTRTEHKVLGMNWNLDSDVIVLKIDKIVEFAQTLELTKRNILRMSAKLFDPLEIVAPILVPIKVLFQELCADKYDWDTPLPDEKRKTIHKWLADISKNRVNNILELTDKDMWSHCPGVENPADIGSRGCLPSILINTPSWWEGPPWLKLQTENFPKLDVGPQIEDDSQDSYLTSEIRLTKQEKTSTAVYVTTTQTKARLVEIVDCNKYSTYSKLIKVTALVR